MNHYLVVCYKDKSQIILKKCIVIILFLKNHFALAKCISSEMSSAIGKLETNLLVEKTVQICFKGLHGFFCCF